MRHACGTIWLRHVTSSRRWIARLYLRRILTLNERAGAFLPPNCAKRSGMFRTLLIKLPLLYRRGILFDFAASRSLCLC